MNNKVIITVLLQVCFRSSVLYIHVCTYVKSLCCYTVHYHCHSHEWKVGGNPYRFHGIWPQLINQKKVPLCFNNVKGRRHPRLYTVYKHVLSVNISLNLLLIGRFYIYTYIFFLILNQYAVFKKNVLII